MEPASAPLLVHLADLAQAASTAGFQWWLQHADLPLALVWGLGAWLAIRRGRRLLGVVFALLLLCLLMGLIPWDSISPRLSWAGAADTLVSAQWFALATIVIASRWGSRRSPGLTSLLPLMLATQGLGALMLGVAIAGMGLLERGMAGRGWLATTLILFGLAGWLDNHTLRVWVLVVNNLPLGFDAASLLVDSLVEIVRLVAWAAALFWALRAGPTKVSGPLNR